MFNFSDETAVLSAATNILHDRLTEPKSGSMQPADAKAYVKLHFAGKEREEFFVMFLDVRLRLIAEETLSIGTLSETAVHPREVVKAALRYNAANVIISHNHPSGDSSPSDADIRMTRSVGVALALMDVTLLDHFIVGNDVHSMVESNDVKMESATNELNDRLDKYSLPKELLSHLGKLQIL